MSSAKELPQDVPRSAPDALHSQSQRSIPKKAKEPTYFDYPARKGVNQDGKEGPKESAEKRNEYTSQPNVLDVSSLNSSNHSNSSELIKKQTRA